MKNAFSNSAPAYSEPGRPKCQRWKEAFSPVKTPMFFDSFRFRLHAFRLARKTVQNVSAHKFTGFNKKKKLSTIVDNKYIEPWSAINFYDGPDNF